MKLYKFNEEIVKVVLNWVALGLIAIGYLKDYNLLINIALTVLICTSNLWYNKK